MFSAFWLKDGATKSSRTHWHSVASRLEVTYQSRFPASDRKLGACAEETLKQMLATKTRNKTHFTSWQEVSAGTLRVTKKLKQRTQAYKSTLKWIPNVISCEWSTQTSSKEKFTDSLALQRSSTVAFLYVEPKVYWWNLEVKVSFMTLDVVRPRRDLWVT